MEDKYPAGPGRRRIAPSALKTPLSRVLTPVLLAGVPVVWNEGVVLEIPVGSINGNKEGVGRRKEINE
jgi:hypothetical protein